MRKLRAFIDSVRDGTPPLVDGRVGQKALEVAMQVKEKILNS